MQYDDNQQEQPQNSSWSQRENQFATATAIQIRLGNDKIINDLVRYLTGIEEMEIPVKNPDGSRTTIVRRVQVGERKANDIGIQSILSLVSSCINPLTVQGAYTEELYFYDTDIIFKKIEMALMVNRIRWGIQQDDYPIITGMLKDLFGKFGTRLIGNKEREALTPTVVSHETITQNPAEQKNSFWGIPLPSTTRGQ